MRYLLERFERGESAIFLAFENGAAIGFTQLLSELLVRAMARLFILNDLFVTPEARRRGTALALLALPRTTGGAAARFGLSSTELDNTIA